MAPRIPLKGISLSDVLFGITVAVIGTVEALALAAASGAAHAPEPWWIPLAVAIGALTVFRRKAPVPVFIALVLLQYVWHRFGHEDYLAHHILATMMVFRAFGSHLVITHSLPWALAGVLIFDSGAVGGAALSLREAGFLTGVFCGAYLTGLALRTYRMRALRRTVAAERAEAERERRATEAVTAERARIARELHDVVAHSVGMMVMQAGALRRAQGGENPTLLGIEQAGREAVNELRVMLGALRMPQDEALPQPGLDLVRNLIATVNSSRLRITLTIEGEPVRLAPGLDLSAYRIIQEALANAVKYAGDADVRIRIAHHPLSITLEITDNGTGAESALSTGYGLIGMRERTELFGGTLEAGPLPERGFRVLAVLPTSQGVVLV